jgi:hypothetical protein
VRPWNGVSMRACHNNNHPMISRINRTEDNDFDEAFDVNESAPNDLASLVNMGIGYAQ